MAKKYLLPLVQWLMTIEEESKLSVKNDLFSATRSVPCLVKSFDTTLWERSKLMFLVSAIVSAATKFATSLPKLTLALMLIVGHFWNVSAKYFHNLHLLAWRVSFKPFSFLITGFFLEHLWLLLFDREFVVIFLFWIT